jgi:hypothetical protein
MLFSRNARTPLTTDVVRPARAHSAARVSRGRRQVIRDKAGRWGRHSLKVLVAVLIEIQFP